MSVVLPYLTCKVCAGRKILSSLLTYHTGCGISLAMFLVRQGALNGEAQFRPKIPPMTVRGKPTRWGKKTKLQMKCNPNAAH